MVKNSVPDVEMKDASSPASGADEQETKDEVKKDPDLLTLEDIREHVRHIEKAVATKEPRFMSRVIRGLVSVRRKLTSTILRKLIHGYYTCTSQQKEELTPYLVETGTVNGIGTPFRPRTGKASNLPLLPELEIYFNLLVVIYLIDQKKYTEAVKCSTQLVNKIALTNRRTLDMLAAKCYYYHSRTYELTDKLEVIRGFLHARLRTATLRSDFEGQATLINLLLRNYLHYNLYEQADKLISKSTFPETSSNNEWARYLYYLGRVKAAQLEYSDSHKHLVQAMRKAPQYSAIGFKQTVQRLAIVVELLLGDIPDRQTFRQTSMKKTLAPYFQLTQAVRGGNLTKFNSVLAKFGSKFQAEDTYTLIIRLRHNVIKTGVRKISLSYSRISLMDVASKLSLDSPEDAEYIVAKAIRDGVIEAHIDHEKGYVKSRETNDIYTTREPMAAFHQRISFCLGIHNHSVKAMRFPPKSYSKDLESAEDRREREQQELESAKEIADEDFDGFP